MSAGAIFITLVVAMFPALILVALVVKLAEIREASRWPATTGKVIASRVESRKNKPSDASYGFSDTEVTNEPFVEYEYTVGKRKLRCHRVTIGEKFDGTELEEVLERYPVGKVVTVFYNPAKPEVALLERTLPMGRMTVGFLYVMGFFIGVPLIAAVLYFNTLGWLKTHMADPGRAPLVAISSGFGLAVALFAIAFFKHVRKACSWPVTRGKISEANVEAFRPWRDGTSTYGRTRTRFKPGVVYSYEVDGRKYLGDRLTIGIVVSSTLPGLAGRTAAKYRVGSEVDVHYNPLSPGESVLSPRSSFAYLLWVVATILLAFSWALATGRLR
ncbi:DUF3592 domain-containing protein [Singulisphaera rosea]